MKNTIRYGAEDLTAAAETLRKGGLVGVPTETVYGLAVDARSSTAVEEVYRTKHRDSGKPLSVLITGMKMTEEYCRDIPPAAYRLAEAYWPGPITMVLKEKELLPKIVTASTGTLGVRCPDHPMTLELIRKLNAPLAAPSANPSDLPSPTCAQDVLDYFDGKIDGVVDGGPCTVGVESTVVDLTGDKPKILREGCIPAGEILMFLKENGK